MNSERILLSICPDRIGVVRRKSAWKTRKRPLEQGAIHVPQVSAAEGWRPALDMVERCIVECNIRNASAVLTLSNHFTRFALVPWSAQVQRLDEEATLVRARFESQYGDMSAWTIQLNPGRYGVARIACAIEAELLDQLRRLFGAHRIACPVLQPYFVAGWNRGQRQFGKTDALFAVVESNIIVMAAMKGEQWHSVRAVHGKADAQSLQVLLEREALLQGFTEMPQIGILAPSLRSADTAAWPGSMRLLESGETVSEAALAMALAGDGA